MYPEVESIEKMKLGSMMEDTIFVQIPGFEFEEVSFRLANLTEKELSMDQAKIIGVNVRIPDEERKVFSEDGGAYATVEKERALLKFLSLPNRKDKVIEDITLTVEKIENR